jgi:hypothetical protein
VFRELIKEAARIIDQLDQHERHASMAVGAPADDHEALQLCAKVLDDLVPTSGAVPTTTELALASYLRQMLRSKHEARSGAATPEIASTPLTSPEHSRFHPVLRLSNRTIKRAVILPLLSVSPLPMEVQMLFTDGSVLVAQVSRPLRMMEATGTVVVFPDDPPLPTSQEIDTAIAAGVDPGNEVGPST